MIIYKNNQIERLTAMITRISLIVACISLPINHLVCNATLIIAFISSSVYFYYTRRFNLSISILPVLLFFLYVTSFFYSDNFREVLRSFELSGFFFIVPMTFAFAGQIITERFRGLLLKVFFATILCATILSYVHIAIKANSIVPNSYSGEFTYHEEFTRYNFSRFISSIHPTYLSIYLLFCIVVIFEGTRIKLIAKVIITAVLTAFLILLSAKNQLILLLFILPFLMWRHINIKPFLKLSFISLLLTCLIAVAVSDKQIRYRFTTELKSSNGDRMRLWQIGANVIGDNWLIGVGMGDRKDVVNQSLMDNDARLNDYNLHNQYLDYWMALGLPALLIFVLILALPVIKRANVTFCLFSIIIAVSCCTESILYRRWGLEFFLLFYGVLGTSVPFKAIELTSYFSEKNQVTKQ